MKNLGDTFDAMLERLDRLFDSQRRFVAIASNEPRTPLTINRTLIEVALDDPQANEAIRQLGTKLLAVSPVDLADIAQYIATESQGAAHAAHIDIHSHLRPARVSGDPVLLERLTQNLPDNAIRYNLADAGEITVTTDVVNGHAPTHRREHWAA